MDRANLSRKSEVDPTGNERRTETGPLGKHLRAEMAASNADRTGDIASLRSDTERPRREMTIRMVGMSLAGFGVMLAAMRHMQLHP